MSKFCSLVYISVTRYRIDHERLIFAFVQAGNVVYLLDSMRPISVNAPLPSASNPPDMASYHTLAVLLFNPPRVAAQSLLCTDHGRLYILFNLDVAYAAPTALIAPMNKHTAIAFGPSVTFSITSSLPFPSVSSPSCSSGCLPGSSISKTIMLMNVPTNCGSVVNKLRIPR